MHALSNETTSRLQARLTDAAYALLAMTVHPTDTLDGRTAQQWADHHTEILAELRRRRQAGRAELQAR